MFSGTKGRHFSGRWLGELYWGDPTIPLLIFGSIHFANVFFCLLFIRYVLVSLRNGPLNASLSKGTHTYHQEVTRVGLKGKHH